MVLIISLLCLGKAVRSVLMVLKVTLFNITRAKLHNIFILSKI